MIARASRALVTLFVTRVAGAGVFGIFTVATAAVEVVSRLTIFGMDKSLLKFLPGATSPYPVLSAVFRTALVLSLVATGIVAVWAPWIAATLLKTPSAAVPLRMAALAILPLTFVFLLLAATKAKKIMRYDAMVMGMVLPLSLLLFAIPILWTEDDALTMALAYGASALTAVLVSFRFFGKHYSLSRSVLTSPGRSMGELLSFSTPLGLHDFVQFLGMKLELFILAFFMSPVSLGIYALAAELSFVIKKFRQIFDPILIPLMAEAHGLEQMDRVQENVARVIRWILMLGILYVGGMILFGRPILGIFGEEFVVGGTVLVLLCLAQLVNSATGLLDMAMMVSGRPRINLLNICILLVVQAGLNLWLIPRYGLLGAGAAALAAFLVLGLVRLAQSFWILKLNPFAAAQLKPVLAGLGGGAAVVGGRSLAGPWEGTSLWVALLALFILTYLLTLKFLGFEEEDAALWRRLRRRSR